MNTKIPAFITSSLVAAAALAIPVSAGAQDIKIGYIITQRLIAESQIGQGAAEELKKKMESANSGLQDKLANIKALEQDLEKRSMVLSDAERKKAADQLEKELVEAKRMKEDFQRSLQKAEGQVMGKVNVFLREVIEDYGKANGYDLILDASTLLYISPKPDLTDQVIKMADKKKR